MRPAPRAPNIVRAAAAAALVCTACGRNAGGGGPSGAASGAAAASPAGSSASAASPSGSAAAPGPSGSAAGASAGVGSRWEGTYTAKPGAVEVPDEAKDKIWPHDPAAAAASGGPAIGSGTISLELSGSHGEVTGSMHGALGDLLVTGVFDGSELRANVAPASPNEPLAMTGWMVLGAGGPASASTGGAAAAEKTLTGTMRVASRDAKVVRDADVKLSPRAR